MELEVIDVVHQEARIGPAGKRSIVKLVQTNQYFTMMYVEFPIGARPEEHVKPNAEMIYVLDGEHTIEFPEVDSRQRHVRAGSAIYLPPGIRHRHTNTAKATTKILVVASPPAGETKLAQTSPVVDVSKL
ncbi:MAG: cupin domain-containing protein [Chloroflexi bacterium]|nr:cupin domain-containing protein [Chloroflexota bacterium]